jgi:predicted dehydrogenase
VSGPVRIGVAGCGGIARRVHLRLLPQLTSTRIAALADHNPSNRAQAAAMAPGAAVFASVEEMLSKAEIDAVIVALPTFAHTDAAIAVLESGRHLYLESPLAGTLDEGRRIVDAWQRAGRVGAIGLNSRFHPLLVEAKQAIDSAAIGDVVAARIAFSSERGSRPAWAEDPAKGGGVLLDKAYHEVDVVRVLLGEIDDVFCVAADRGPRPATVGIELRCRRGCLAQLSIGIGSVADARLDVYGTNGRLSFGRYESLRVAVDPSSAGGVGRRLRRGSAEIAGGVGYLARKLRSPGNDPSFGVALERFVDAVQGSAGARAASPDLSEGLACLAVIDAARRSLEEGRLVTVERSW